MYCDWNSVTVTLALALSPPGPDVSSAKGPYSLFEPSDVGVAEACHGHPRRDLVLVGQYPVLATPEPPVADQLEETRRSPSLRRGAGDVSVHPPSAEACLQAAVGVRVLQQHGQEAGVRMRAAPQRRGRRFQRPSTLRTRRTTVASVELSAPLAGNKGWERPGLLGLHGVWLMAMDRRVAGDPVKRQG